MSKGPGSVQRKIQDYFQTNNAGWGLTNDICRHVYGKDTKITSDHRRSIRRAIGSIQKELGWLRANAICQASSNVFYDAKKTVGFDTNYFLNSIRNDIHRKLKYKLLIEVDADLKSDDKRKLKELVSLELDKLLTDQSKRQDVVSDVVKMVELRNKDRLAGLVDADGQLAKSAVTNIWPVVESKD